MNELIELIGLGNLEEKKDKIKKFTFIFVLYLISIFTIIRSNYKYIDDMGRSIVGYRGWGNFSRHISNILSSIFHVNPEHLTDIAPLTQIIACVFLACASIILVYILNEKKVTYIHLIASMVLGISPWFLECLSYHFDAPYMALSVLVSIFPFLYINNFKKYFPISIISLLIMCMTYQASSGIYIILTIFISFLMYLKNKQSFGYIGKFILVSIVAYILSWLIFIIVFQNKQAAESYASVEMMPFNELLPGVVNNIIKYIDLIIRQSAKAWKILFLISVIICVLNLLRKSKKKIFITLLLTIVVLTIMVILSKGVYLAISTSMLYPRANYGIGVFTAIILISAIPTGRMSKFNIISIIPIMYFIYSLVIFSFMYENALESQDKYVSFKYDKIVRDLSFLTKDDKVANVKFVNAVIKGHSKEVNNIYRNYPIIKSLVHDFENPQWYWSNQKFKINYNLNIKVIREQMNKSGMKKVIDNFYYIIYKNNNNYIIEVKN